MSQIVDTERPEPLSGSGDPPRDLLLDVKDLSVEFDTGHGPSGPSTRSVCRSERARGWASSASRVRASPSLPGQ
uniref:Uncharacterized protein n=1 Tax=Janibacter limosus TaxID=53458 RepID=A0AC61U5X4_9MICO|nr:hypothetical protein [Janibacter limosus]